MVRSAAAGPPPPATGNVRRLIRRRTGLPGSRSVVGGLLVAVAALGTWWAAAGGGAGTAQPRYLVAARAIGPGQVISRRDLALASAEVPGAVRSGLFLDPAALEGTIALGPVRPGELIQAGAIAPAGPNAGARELSFSVDREWAVAGSLRPGDHVDVYATDADTDPPRGRRVLADVVLQRVDDRDDQGLGGSSTQTLTVAVTDPGSLAETVAATRAGPVTIVRVTTMSASETKSSDRSTVPNDRVATTTTPVPSAAPPAPPGTDRTPTTRPPR